MTAESDPQNAPHGDPPQGTPWTDYGTGAGWPLPDHTDTPTREPATTEIPDEAVLAAAKALETVVKRYPVDPNRKPWEGTPIGATFHELARAALTAAVPLIDLGNVHNGHGAPTHLTRGAIECNCPTCTTQTQGT